MNEIILYAAYRTRCGHTATITALDTPGLRPVAATITGDGPPYTRYYTYSGSEYAALNPADTPEQSPYDLTALIEQEKPSAPSISAS